MRTKWENVCQSLFFIILRNQFLEEVKFSFARHGDDLNLLES